MERPVNQTGALKLGMPVKVMIAINDAWNIYNFSAGLIKSLLEKGYEVIAVAPESEYAPRLQTLGCRFFPIPIECQGTNPGNDMLLLFRFIRMMRRERPDVFLGYTVKPNVYGSMAAKYLGIPAINTITGLGAAFTNDSFMTRIVKNLYSVSLRNSRKVFFQNEDDRHYFIESGMSNPEVADLLPGSGVDLDHFSRQAISSLTDGKRERFRFLLIARMLWDKGVGEYVEAARMLRTKFPHVEFCLLGFLDVQNPAAISREQIEAWVDEGTVNYLGVTDDVRPEIDNADCIVLPSYREGTPRTLLEAAAMAKPIIATDAVGCREVVEDQVTGLLCKLFDADDLARTMERLLEMSHEARLEMGSQGRAKVEEQFDEQIVIEKYLDTINEVISPRTISPTDECRLWTPDK